QVGTPNGGTEIHIRDNPQSAWRTWLKANPEENVGVDGISADGRAAIVETSIGSDTARVVLKDFASGNETLIASSPDVDAGVVMVNPKTHNVEAVSFEPGRRTWRVINPSVKLDFDAIARLDPGDFTVINRDV